ncbi:MAG: mandelate racemase/muconate lactonizing enzyme family protein [Acidimicrobiales bacterium]|nr:mandelate racemase/muconate lactonizing enzyme family protein [Acidimicrobiales bacterium]
MPVVRFQTSLVVLPLAKPIGTAIHSIRSVGCVLLEIETDQGVVGQSYIFTINADRLGAFDEMVRGLSHFVIGRDPCDTGAIWSDIWNEINATGHKGVTVAAMAAIDVACWDAVGRSIGLPLHKLFGACRDRIDTYASSGLWLSYSVDELQAEASSFISQGFTAMKLRLGMERIQDDIERVAKVREAVGPDVRLLVDANQKFSPKHAIALGRRMEPFDITWFEEPVITHNRRGSAEVRAALDMPIATGETEYTRYGIKDLIDARAGDILMPDLQRIGGYTEFAKAAALSAAHDLPVSTHFFTEQSLAIAAATANCISVEHTDWFSPLFNEEPEIVAGQILVPDRPGTGFTLAADLLKRFPLRS